MVIDTLEDLRTALDGENTARVVDLIPDVLDVFEQAKSREEARQRIARRVRDSASESATRGAAEALLDSTTRIKGAKLRVNEAMKASLTGSDHLDRVEAVTEAIETYERYNERVEVFESATEDVDLPALAALSIERSIPVPKGGSIDVPVTVTNPGSVPVESVELSVSSDFGIGLSETEIENLGAGETVTVRLAGPVSGETQSLVTVAAETTDAIDEERSQIIVVDKKTILESVLDQLRELFVALKKALSDGPGGGGRGQGLENKIEVTTRRVVRVIDAIIEGDQPRDALDHRIGAVQHQIESFKNQINAKEGNLLTSGDAYRLRVDADDIDSTLQRARQAEL